MQLSEFRDLLANDGFAATFQTMGQYRTELLRAIDKLRAQADARPVARFHLDEAELDALYEAIEWAKDEGLPGTAEHLQAIFDAHDHEASAQPMCVKCGDGIMAHDPGTCGNCHAMGDEASAPGLSDEVRAVLKEAHACIGNLPDGHSDHVRQAACKEAITRILTRASAATPTNEADK